MNRNLFPGRRRSFEQERAQADAQKPQAPVAATATADEAMPPELAKEERGALEEAKQFLARRLANGPVPATVVRGDGEDAGHSWAAIRRAKRILGVEAVKDGMKGGWMWEPPLKVLIEGAPRQTRNGS